MSDLPNPTVALEAIAFPRGRVARVFGPVCGAFLYLTHFTKRHRSTL